MLTRCTVCGKPVCTTGTRGMAECGYCYTRIRITDRTEGMPPWELDWKKPLFDAAVLGLPGQEEEWLLFLGSYEDAAQRLAQRRKEAEEARARKSAAEKQRREAIYQRIRSLSEENAFLKEANALARQLDSIPEEERDPELAALFERKIKAIRYRADIARIAELQKEIDTYYSPETMDDILAELVPLSELPGAMDAIARAQERKSLLLKQRKELQEAQARAARRKKRIRTGLCAAAVFTAVLLCILSLFVWQPRKLEEARSQAEAGQYESAAAAYESLTDRLLIRPKVKSAAREELKSCREAWALALIGQEKWEEAIAQYALVPDPSKEKKTRLEYAAWLEQRARWEDAIGQYSLAGEKEAEENTRREYAMLAENRGEYQTAIEQWSHLPDHDEQLARLYALDTLKAYREGNYQDAVRQYSKADPDRLALEGVTLEILFRDWGFALAEAGDRDNAISRLANAGDTPDVRNKRTELLLEREKEKIGLAMDCFRNPADGMDSVYGVLAQTGKELETLDGLLMYFTELTDAGADLMRVFADGALVKGLTRPEPEEADRGAFDFRRPLVLWRQEQEYLIDAMDGHRDTYSLHEGEGAFQWRLLPDFWLRLPPERRAKSGEDCTCVLLMDLTYPYQGLTYAGTLMWDYVSVMQNNQSGKARPAVTPWRKLAGMGHFPSFSASCRLILWDPHRDIATVLDSREVTVKSGFPGRITIDWTHYSNLLATANTLGLAGNFDTAWAHSTLESAFARLLSEGGTGSD